MKSLRVLYLDDEEDILELAKIFFEERGHNLITFSRTQDAIEYLQSHQVDVVISDANIPQMKGLEFASVVRQRKLFQGIFILVSGHYDYQQKSVPKEVDHFLMKPLDFEQLVQQIQILISSRIGQ